MTRILFSYISPSSGHQRAADAVREALSLLAPSWETSSVDSLSYAYPTIGRWIARSYLEMLRHTPALWDLVYDNPDVEEATREIRELLNLISAGKMKKLVKKNNPSALVCTQAVPCTAFSAEKRRGRLHIPLVAVVTDFAIHAYWIHEEVDLYCVPSEEVKRDLIRRGIQASAIAVTGIPISPSFLRHVPQDVARQRLRLEPQKPTILVMGGSQGMGPLEETLDQLHQLPVQLLVVTGINRKLYRFLVKRFQRDRRVKVFGYTRMINLLMDASDLLVTKPGGLTSSEALAKSLPMLITNPIPGQEERNADFLEKSGVAVRADEPDEIASVVKSLIDHPARLRKMQDAARALATPYSAMEVARHLFRLTNATR